MQSIASLYSYYVEAGFDPSAFWALTPRQYLLQMAAGARQQRVRQALAAEAAWMGQHADAKDFDRYVAELRGEDTSLPPEALAGVLRNASAGMPSVSWSEFLENEEMQ